MSLFGIFGSDDSPKRAQVSQTSDEDPRDNVEVSPAEDLSDDEEEETVTLVAERVENDRWTVHLATASFTDGTEKRYMFDGMKKNEHGISLYNYTGTQNPRGHSRRPKEVFATIAWSNLKDFVTDHRRKVTVESERQEERHEMSRSKAEQMMEDEDYPSFYENVRIKEDH